MKKETQIPLIKTDKIVLAEIIVLKSMVNCTDNYLSNTIKPEKVVMQLGTESRFNFDMNLCKFRMHITLVGADENDNPIGLSAEFLLDFTFIVENLTDFVTHKKGGTQVHKILGATLLGIAFSTARGIALERTKGTPFAGFILPVINPGEALSQTMGIKLEPNPVSALAESEIEYKASS